MCESRLAANVSKRMTSSVDDIDHKTWCHAGHYGHEGVRRWVVRLLFLSLKLPKG
jgi:hypothetical protein